MYPLIIWGGSLLNGYIYLAYCHDCNDIRKYTSNRREHFSTEYLIDGLIRVTVGRIGHMKERH